MSAVRSREFFAILWGSLLGLAAIIAGPLVTGGQEYSSFLPWIRRGVESLSWVSIAGLGAAGFLGGYFSPGNDWIRGYATILLLPVWAFIEMGLDPTSHNLWPLEFGVYGVIGLAGVVGARLGRWLSPKKGGE